MYMDETGVRSPHGRTDAELLHQLQSLRNPGGCSGGAMVRSGMGRNCDGSLRGGDHRNGMMPRGENALGGNAHTDGCGCDSTPGEIGNSYHCGENGVEGRSLAMVYAPVQAWHNAYDPQTALRRGTLFRELDMPFYGGRNPDKGGNCRGC